jgi:hypothetical protein
MKKNYTFYGVLLGIPIVALTFISSAGGMSGGLSGSPGDGSNSCVQCHSGGNFNAVGGIITNIPGTGYVAGQTYNVSVTVTSSSTKHGFQITAEDASGNKLGNFTAGTGNQVVNANKAVTHTSVGTSQTTWNFTWTAPSTGAVPVNFYAAINATNANFNSTGDQVVLASRGYEVLSTDQLEDISFQVYPNPTENQIFLKGNENFSDFEIQIVNIHGQIVQKTQYTVESQSIDVSNLESGVYFIHLSNDSKKGNSKFVKL